MIIARHCDIEAFQKEMEDNFRLDCNNEDIKTCTEARKCKKYIDSCRTKVNIISKLRQKILNYD